MRLSGSPSMYMASTYLPTYLPTGWRTGNNTKSGLSFCHLPTYHRRYCDTARSDTPTLCLCFDFLSALECLALLQALHIGLLPHLFARLLRLFPLFVARPSRDSSRIPFPPPPSPLASCIIRKQMWIMTVGWEEEVGQGEETEREWECFWVWRTESSRFVFTSFVVNNDVRLRGEVEEGSGFGKNKGNRGKRGGWGWEFVAELFHHSLCITWRGRRWAMDDYMREMGDLKTLVTKTLEKKGVLARIRVSFLPFSAVFFSSVESLCCRSMYIVIFLLMSEEAVRKMHSFSLELWQVMYIVFFCCLWHLETSKLVGLKWDILQGLDIGILPLDTYNPPKTLAVQEVRLMFYSECGNLAAICKNAISLCRTFTLQLTLIWWWWSSSSLTLILVTCYVLGCAGNQQNLSKHFGSGVFSVIS